MNCGNFKKIIILAFLVILSGALIVLSACSITQNSVTQLLNSPAPDFNLKDLDGNDVKLSGLMGKTVLINFWKTTSPACVHDLPIFQELYNEWDGRGDVVFLSIDLGEGSAKVNDFVERRNYTFPVYMDTHWEAGRLYQIHAFPTTCLVDNQGYLRFFFAGPFQDRAVLDEKLADWLP